MAVEVGLTDGTKLKIADSNITEDDVLKMLERAGKPEYSAIAGFVSLDTDQGSFRVSPAHVVYVRYAVR